MPHTSEIEKAFDDLIIDEAGMKFQALAVVLAKQKWPRLITCERKKDLGLDAYASGELEPDGNGFGLACSLTPEYEKIAADATKVKKNFPDVHCLLPISRTHRVLQYGRQSRERSESVFELGMHRRREITNSALWLRC